MITVSDNDSANELVRKLGGGDFQTGAAIVNEFCQERNYTSTHLGREFLASDPTDDNYTSASDCCRLLSDIYNSSLVNAEASAAVSYTHLDVYKRQENRFFFLVLFHRTASYTI